MWSGPADSEKNVLDGVGVARARLIAPPAEPVTGQADIKEHRRVDRPGVDDHPGELHPTVAGRDDGSVAPLWDEGGEALCQHHGVRAGHHDRLIQVIDARGQNEVLAEGKRQADDEGRGAWVGNKEGLIGSEYPGPGLVPDHEVPDVFVWTAGTKTSNPPELFMYR